MYENHDHALIESVDRTVAALLRRRYPGSRVVSSHDGVTETDRVTEAEVRQAQAAWERERVKARAS